MQKNRKKVLTFCNTDSILIKSVAVATDEYGILAQLGEHLPYKQRVIGSSPIGSICRSGGTGRRPGLKIPWVVIPVPVRFRSAALVKNGRNVEFTAFLLFFCFKMFEHL